MSTEEEKMEAYNAAMFSALDANIRLNEEIRRIKKALELTLYYIEGDSAAEAVKEKVDLILKSDA